MEIEKRLEKAIEAREKLAGEVKIITGKKQAAESALEEIEQEIREANLDPETLGETLKTLEEALLYSIQDFELKLQKAQDSLTPFMEK